MSDSVKSRIRVPAGSAPLTADSFTNFAANLGYGTNNLSSGGGYQFQPLSRNHYRLEMMYRGSWLARQIIDSVAEDMTRAGIMINSDMPPDEIDDLMRSWNRMGLWAALQNTAKWGRLYGGAIAVMMIEGQLPDTPLRVNTVMQGQFKGLLVFDRWMLTPSLENLVTTLGPDHGMPKFYRINSGISDMADTKVHHSRVVRYDGVSLPYWQRIAENGWGLSVLEPMQDRMLAFDSATQGAAQLVYKAHLRTLSVERLRELIAAGGKAYKAFLDQINLIRLMQTNEGLTVLDSTDKFEALAYAFTGLNDVLIQFGQQLAGAAQIPLVRLFGQSPAGMNATGESDVRNYYDTCNAQQEARLRRPVGTLLELTYRNRYGRDLPAGFDFSFRPLWQLPDDQKATVASTITTSVLAGLEQGAVSRQTALKELRQQSKVTGVWSNITDEDIDQAEDEVPKPDMNAGMPGADPNAPPDPNSPDPTGGGLVPEQAGGGKAQPAPSQVLPFQRPARQATDRKASVLRLLRPTTRDRQAIIDIGGLQCVIETARGERRIGNGWTSPDFPCDYGYISNTGSAEGNAEQTDCFVGPDHASDYVVLIDQVNAATGDFDEHKVMLGYRSKEVALSDYANSFSDRQGYRRVGGITEMNIAALRDWLVNWPYRLTRDAFESTQHPRATAGKHGGEFVRKGAGTGGGASAAKTKPASAQAAPTGSKAPPAEATPLGKINKPLALRPTSARAYIGTTIATRTKMNKLETGATGEAAVISYLKMHGIADARPLNLHTTNFPVDLIGDHQLVEVKTGLVSNGPTAKHWRATIGQPGKVESAWLATASKEDKSNWNKAKQQAILDRKHAVLQDMSKEHGVQMKAKTVTTILNPDTKTVDLFVFDGFHSRIPWDSDQAKAGYVGSYHYE